MRAADSIPIDLVHVSPDWPTILITSALSGVIAAAVAFATVRWQRSSDRKLAVEDDVRRVEHDRLHRSQLAAQRLGEGLYTFMKVSGPRGSDLAEATIVLNGIMTAQTPWLVGTVLKNFVTQAQGVLNAYETWRSQNPMHNEAWFANFSAVHRYAGQVGAVFARHQAGEDIDPDTLPEPISFPVDTEAELRLRGLAPNATSGDFDPEVPSNEESSE